MTADTNHTTRITLAMLSQQVEALREDMRQLRDELRGDVRSLREELHDTLCAQDQRLRTVEQEQARLGERAGILTLIGTAIATGVATLVGILRK